MSTPPRRVADSETPERHPRLRHPTAGETTLYLVRHGRTAGNVAQLLHGVTDVPLDPFGIRQAACIAERLAGEPEVDVLLSSPLSRAAATARIIGERIGREPVVVPELIEMDFGTLEGASVDRLLADHPEIAQRMGNIDDFDVAWPDGESRGGFYARVNAAFAAILETYAAHRVIVVAHGGVIGAFLASIVGRSPNDPAIYDLMNCSLTHLQVTVDHTVLHLRNDVRHLAVLVEHESELESEA